MAELTFKSPGVSTREIDLSGPTQTGPSGIPAGVIGTAKQGRAFVPITVATFADFIAEFGDTDSTQFGPLAMRQWLSYASAGTFIRTLGVGNGKKRGATGLVTNAGFVVGDRQVQANGNIGQNPFTGQTTSGVGRTAATLTAANALTLINANPAFTIGGGIPGPVADETVLFKMTIVLPAGVSESAAETTYVINMIAATDETPNADSTSNHINIAINNGTSGITLSGTNIRDLLRLAINGGHSNTRIGYSSAGDVDATDGIPNLTASDVSTTGLTLTLSTKSSDGNSATLKIEADPDSASGVSLSKTTPQAFSTAAGLADDTEVNFSGGETIGPGGLGRAHFLGVIMSQSNGSNIFTDAGLNGVQPILRGVLLAPSGVNLSLSASRSDVTNNTPLSGPGATDAAAMYAFGSGLDGGSTYGAVNIGGGRQEFVLLQNGHKHTDSYPTILTASFDVDAPNYFANVFNTDPTKTEQAGHCLYAHYDIHPNLAAVTGSSLMDEDYRNTARSLTKEGVTIENEEIAFLLTGSAGRNTGTATKPNFEAFNDRFRTAKFPTVISQEFGGKNKDLFTVHCLDDGEIGNHRVKVSIENIIKSTNVNNKYGTFDLLVRDYTDTDAEPKVLERFVKCSLDPSNERYVARVIGDYHIFYDFDKRAGGQKLVVEGSYANASNYIRVVPSTELERGQVPDTALPVGFRGIQHLVTSGSSIFGAIDDESILVHSSVPTRLVQPPIQFRRSVGQGTPPRKRVNTALYWGVQLERQTSVAQPNSSTSLDESILNFGKYFPNYRLDERPVMIDGSVGVADNDGTILDADRFNNNKFTLENIQVITTTADKADPQQWAAATYKRAGTASSELVNIDGTETTSTRLLSVDKDFGLSTARPFLKFSMIAQGGFDGLNIYDLQKTRMTSTAVRREMTDADNQGGTAGPTTAAYRKALDVMAERSDVDIQLLAIPGIRHSAVTDYAITTVEDRFDALYLMDIEVEDVLGTVVTASNQDVSVTSTASTFNARNLDSSFAAAYFPDVVMRDPNTGAATQVPPSVAVLGAFGLNDSVAFPWYAPAGFTRGALKDVSESSVKLNRTNLDTLYEADINPITSFPQSRDVVVFGQKTLLAAQSALDRVNVRRLLIDIRRQVRRIGDTFLFEPNRESTLARFAAAVNPVLQRIQAQQGLARFKVQIDTTTTTQADIENNTVRGKIFLQPVRSVEFISLDFVVTNAGMDI